MIRKAIFILLTVVFLLPGFAGAVSEKDFEVHTAQELINLCSVSADDPLYHQAINFCHGYFEGAYQYYEAMTAGPESEKFVCVPQPKPSRNKAIGMFIEWAKSNSQYMQERPVEAEFRFLQEKWPCK